MKTKYAFLIILSYCVVLTIFIYSYFKLSYKEENYQYQTKINDLENENKRLKNRVYELELK